MLLEVCFREANQLTPLPQPNAASTAPNSPAGVRDAALIAILYSAGLRRSEVVKLLVSDYDLAEGSLTVRGGKGGKDRVCYISESALTLLADWLTLRGTAATGSLFCPIRRGGHIAYGKALTDQAVLC